MRALFVAALVLLAGGCTPIPFISPPIKATFNPGPMAGTVHVDHGAQKTEGVTANLAGRFGIHPLGLVPSLGERPADFGVGFRLEGTVFDGGWLLGHGPYAEVAYHVWQKHRPGGTFTRLSIFATGELLIAPQLNDALGGGTTGGIGIEWGKWVADPFATQGTSTQTEQKTGNKKTHQTTTFGVWPSG